MRLVVSCKFLSVSSEEENQSGLPTLTKDTPLHGAHGRRKTELPRTVQNRSVLDYRVLQGVQRKFLTYCGSSSRRILPYSPSCPCTHVPPRTKSPGHLLAPASRRHAGSLPRCAQMGHLPSCVEASEGAEQDAHVFIYCYLAVYVHISKKRERERERERFMI